MKGYFIDKHRERTGIVEISDAWVKDCHSLIGTDIVERASRPLNGIWYNFIVDEEGRCKEEQIVTAFGFHDNECIEDLIGSIVILNDDRGECMTLSDADIINIASHVREDGILIFGD